MAEIRDYEKKKYKKCHENNPGGACKNDGMLISSVILLNHPPIWLPR